MDNEKYTSNKEPYSHLLLLVKTTQLEESEETRERGGQSPVALFTNMD